MQYVRTVPEFQFFSQNEFPGDFITFDEVFNELFVENMLAELRRFEELWGSLGLLFCYQTILSRHEHSSCGSNVGVSKNCSYNFKTPYRLTSRYDLYDLQTLSTCKRHILQTQWYIHRLLTCWHQALEIKRHMSIGMICSQIKQPIHTSKAHSKIWDNFWQLKAL